MKTEDYISNGRVSRINIALGVKRRVIRRADIEQLVRDKRVQAEFIGRTYDEKISESNWTREYLDRLANASIAESFNQDYLLYLDKVAEHVAKSERPPVVKGLIIALAVVAALVAAVMSISCAVAKLF